jgi:outer membrane immunogenic protein
VALVINWTGFYVGGNLGGAWGDPVNVTTTNTPGTPPIFGLPVNIAAVNAAGTGSLDQKSAFTIGFEAGYNWQVSPIWLIGVEADIDSLHQHAQLNGVAATTIGTVAITNSVSTDWLATVRGRLGYIFNNWLLFVTGGAAFTRQDYTETFGPTVLVGIPAFGTSTTSSTQTGWTVGGGVETMLTGNWSVKAEYLFARFNGLSTNTTATAVGGFTQLLVGATDHLDVQVARVGLNYRFGYAAAPAFSR